MYYMVIVCNHANENNCKVQHYQYHNYVLQQLRPALFYYFCKHKVVVAESVVQDVCQQRTVTPGHLSALLMKVNTGNILKY